MGGVRGGRVHGVGRLGGLHAAGVRQTGCSRSQKNCERLVGISYTRMDLNVVHLLREDISEDGLFHWSPAVGRACL